MIFGCPVQLEIGQAFTPDAGFTDALAGIHEPQPFFVVREATAQEYIDCAVTQGANVLRTLQAVRSGLYFFYEVQTD